LNSPHGETPFPGKVLVKTEENNTEIPISSSQSLLILHRSNTYTKFLSLSTSLQCLRTHTEQFPHVFHNFPSFSSFLHRVTMDQSISFDYTLHNNLTIICDISRWGAQGGISSESSVKFGVREFDRVRSFSQQIESLCGIVLRGWTDPKLKWKVYHRAGEGTAQWLSLLIDSLISVTIDEKYTEWSMACALLQSERRHSGVGLLHDIARIGDDKEDLYHMGIPVGQMNVSTLEDLFQ